MTGAEPAAEGERLARHQRLLQALLKGDAFATPPASRRLVQTHISSVLLEGGQAWKLRKPLTLPFLDFASVEARRADCEAELRLNRRTAPSLYLDVLPITGSIEAPRIGGKGEAIDWVLKMRRFDDAQQLDRLADAGALDAALVDVLAAVIARFQQSLPPSPAAFGTPASVRSWALDNFETLAATPAAAPAATRLAALRRWTEERFAALQPLLARRHAGGLVREGHGDLHLGNIVLIDGVPAPFDAIEFNPALRHIDTVADIGFTFMDLQRRGLPHLAWRFAAGWADATGDHEGLLLLRYFAVYRALVRAKVALLRGAQGDPAAGDAFERDLALAERLAAPPAGAPLLLLSAGLSGSGKSTAALEFVQALGAPRLRSDVERKRLFGLPPETRPDAAITARLYAPEATQRTYDRVGQLAGVLLAGGLHVIVDAACLLRRERERFAALAAAQGARCVLVWCDAPDAVLQQRLARRAADGQDPSDADAAVLARQRQWLEPPAADEGARMLDTGTDRTTLAQRCEALVVALAGAPA